MSVLIKGMKMPKSCLLCAFGNEFGECCVNMEIEDESEMTHSCPLIELPDHGDLIDRDALKADLGITDWECNKCQWGGLFGCKRDDFSDACFFLENAEAIITAERSEDD